MWSDTRLTRLLGIRWPIVQGPMAGGFSTPALAAAVSNAGGLGSLGVYQLAPDEIARQIAATKQLTDRPFGVNLWVPLPSDTGDARDVDAAIALLAPYRAELGLPPLDTIPDATPHDFERQAEAVLRAGAPVLSVTFGVPTPAVVAEARRRGVRVIGTATTVDEAIALEAGGVDVVCASGFEGGGHRGSFLRPSEESLTGTIALVPQVRDALGIPVIAAGGIADARGVAAALLLGADAAQLGTAFLVTDEAGTGPLHRAALADRARARCTTLTRVFSGRLARAFENRATRELGASRDALAPWPVQGALGRELRAAAERAGRGELSSMYAGQAAALANARPAGEVVASLAAGVDALLGTSRGA